MPWILIKFSCCKVLHPFLMILWTAQISFLQFRIQKDPWLFKNIKFPTENFLDILGKCTLNQLKWWLYVPDLHNTRELRKIHKNTKSIRSCKLIWQLDWCFMVIQVLYGNQLIHILASCKNVWINTGTTLPVLFKFEAVSANADELNYLNPDWKQFNQLLEIF